MSTLAHVVGPRFFLFFSAEMPFLLTRILNVQPSTEMARERYMDFVYLHPHHLLLFHPFPTSSFFFYLLFLSFCLQKFFLVIETSVSWFGP
jgi:hypothetical protein